MTGPFVLTLSCPDRIGIVRAVSGFLADRACNIVDSHQFGDRDNHRFFMRVAFEASAPTDVDTLHTQFAPIGDAASMAWAMYDTRERCRVLVMVSRYDHCLNDLLYRTGSGALPIDITSVVSNHTALAPIVRHHGLPFHHVPVLPDTKRDAESRLLDIVAAEGAELVVLARYMQVLSDTTCATLAGRAINIHHSFLPGFKGAKPYHQAHDRGVKLIGATAHYVTSDLDEGPIIEQEVARVDHSIDVRELIAVGRDLECQALSRAVRWHAERRILLNGVRTIVFR
jgi:formyltetrahydrofolate deformylase